MTSPYHPFWEVSVYSDTVWKRTTHKTLEEAETAYTRTKTTGKVRLWQVEFDEWKSKILKSKENVK